jgi:hypothetical protein
MIHLILAKESDLDAIATMASEIWNQHYVPMIGQAQVDYMLSTFYNQQNLVEQMHKGHHFYLIAQQEEILGFLSVSEIRDRNYFLHKLYIYSQ